MSDLPAYGMGFQYDDAPEYSLQWYKEQLEMCEKELEKLFSDNDLLQAENERLRDGIGRAVDCLRRDCESFGELSSAVCDAQEQLEALHDA